MDVEATSVVATPPVTSTTSSSPHPPLYGAGHPSWRQLQPYCELRMTCPGRIQYAGVLVLMGIRILVTKILLPAASPLNPFRGTPPVQPQLGSVHVAVDMTLTSVPAAMLPPNCTGVALSL